MDKIHTIKSKISLIYLFLVLMIVIVGVVSVVNLYSLTQAIDGLMTDNYKSINAISNMLEAIERQDSAMLIYINADTQKGMDIFLNSKDVFLKWYSVESNNITEAGEREYVNKIYTQYRHYLESFNQLQKIKNSSGSEKANTFYETLIVPDFFVLKQALQSLSGLNEQAMFNQKDTATSNSQAYMYIVLFLSSIAAAGGLLISHFFTNKFLNPLNALTQSVKLVKAGGSELQAIDIFEESICQNDEIGELTREFHNMTNRLIEYDQSNLGKLLTEKNRSIAIVKSITEPLMVLDNSYHILLLNHACEEFFDVREENLVNLHFLEGMDNEIVFNHIENIFESEEDYIEKIILIPKNDQNYYFNIVITKVHDNEANINGLIVVFHNVTDLKQLEKNKTEFIATISHEIKTPLTSIIMGASLLKDKNVGDLNIKQEDIVDAIEEDGERISILVKDLLEISRLESGDTLLNLTLSSIEEIVKTSVRNHIDLAQQKKIQIYSELHGDLPKVYIDAAKVNWVMNNLITNAIKHTEAGDEIYVTAYLQKDNLCVSVRDTGIGIPGDYLDKVFDKFFQIQGKDLEMHGTGLGLAIAKDIITVHGGKIWCESTVGEGSSFIFTLPLNL